MKNSLLIFTTLFSCYFLIAQPNDNTGYWPLDGTVEDLVGTINGTINGAIATTNRYGTESTALKFDGINDLVTLQEKFTFTNSSFSIGFWAYFENDAYGRGGLFQRNPNSPYTGIGIGKGGDDMFYAGITDESGNTLSVQRPNMIFQTWTRFDITYDHNTKTLNLYENGILIDSQTNTAITNSFDETSHHNPVLMHRPGSYVRYTKGKIDDLVFFDRVLSDYEVSLFTNPESTNNWLIAENNVYYEKGNVLIGKSSQVNSDYLLDVEGSIRSNEIKINLDGADYVFESNYSLMSLKEVEEFILENGHLPKIQSATKMRAEGVFIGEMNTLLLSKIEELTLYIIDQNKRLEKLEAENAHLRSSPTK